MEILKYMKSEIASLKRKQEALEFSNPPRLRKFPRLLDLTNNDIMSECLTSEHTYPGLKAVQGSNLILKKVSQVIVDPQFH